MHIPFDSQSALFIFADGSALFDGKTTMMIIPNIWDDFQVYLGKRSTDPRLWSENQWSLIR